MQTTRVRAWSLGGVVTGIVTMLGVPTAAADVVVEPPSSTVFVVGEDGDDLEGSGVSLSDPVVFAAGDSIARYVAVTGVDTDREVHMAVDAVGTLAEDVDGVRVEVSSCVLPGDADVATFRCSARDHHHAGPLSEVEEIAVGVAPAHRGRFVQLVLSLPADAPQELQGATSTVTYTLTATDRGSAPPTETRTPSVDEPVGRLPRTGGSLWLPLLVGVGLILGGLAVVGMARRHVPRDPDGGPEADAGGGARRWRRATTRAGRRMASVTRLVRARRIGDEIGRRRDGREDEPELRTLADAALGLDPATHRLRERA